MITMVMGLLTFDRCAIPVRGIDVAATSLAGLPKFADPAPACRQRTTRQALRAGSRSFSCAHPGLPRSRWFRCSTRSPPPPLSGRIPERPPGLRSSLRRSSLWLSAKWPAAAHSSRFPKRTRRCSPRHAAGHQDRGGLAVIAKAAVPLIAAMAVLHCCKPSSRQTS